MEEEKWSSVKEEADLAPVLFGTRLGCFQMVSGPEVCRGREEGRSVRISARGSGRFGANVAGK